MSSTGVDGTRRPGSAVAAGDRPKRAVTTAAPDAAVSGPAAPAAAAGRPARGRRAPKPSPKPSGDDRQLAILATAERLLAERRLGDISIDDLARGAGISRPTFYFYFPSKDAVLLTLLDSVIAEAERRAAPLRERVPGDPVAFWREVIGAYFETFQRHRAVALAWAEARATNAEVRRLWARVMESWIGQTAEAIEAERGRGVAPAGLPARDLAIALNAMNERSMYATFSGDGPALAEENTLDVLLTIWLTAIYRTSAPRRPGPGVEEAE